MKITKKQLEKLVGEMVLEAMGFDDFGVPRRVTFDDVQAELAHLDHGQAMKFLKKSGFEEVPMSGISNVRVYKRANSSKLYAIKAVSMPRTGKTRLQLEPIDEVPNSIF